MFRINGHNSSLVLFTSSLKIIINIVLDFPTGSIPIPQFAYQVHVDINCFLNFMQYKRNEKIFSQFFLRMFFFSFFFYF